MSLIGIMEGLQRLNETVHRGVETCMRGAAALERIAECVAHRERMRVPTYGILIGDRGDGDTKPTLYVQLDAQPSVGDKIQIPGTDGRRWMTVIAVEFTPGDMATVSLRCAP